MAFLINVTDADDENKEYVAIIDSDDDEAVKSFLEENDVTLQNQIELFDNVTQWPTDRLLRAW